MKHPTSAVVAALVLVTLPAFPQRPQKVTEPLTASPAAATSGNCGAPTNYYSKGNACAYTYSVPAENLNRLLAENPSCMLYSRTQVNCSQPVKGNYGQIQLDGQSSSGVSGGPAPPPGVAPAQRAQADQLWQRAAGLVDQRSYGQALPLLLQGGRLGDVRAQTMLGIIYQDADGVREDDRAAAYWFGAAAAQGNRAAQYALGALYEDGAGGLAKNLATSAELYTKSAMQGFSKAQIGLGLAYELGQGVSHDRTQAIQWLSRSDPDGSNFGGHFALILRMPDTPARFADSAALAQHLVRIHNGELTKMPGTGYSSTSPGWVARSNGEKEYSAWLTDRRSVGIRGNCGSRCAQ